MALPKKISDEDLDEEEELDEDEDAEDEDEEEFDTPKRVNPKTVQKVSTVPRTLAEIRAGNTEEETQPRSRGRPRKVESVEETETAGSKETKKADKRFVPYFKDVESGIVDTQTNELIYRLPPEKLAEGVILADILSKLESIEDMLGKL